MPAIYRWFHVWLNTKYLLNKNNSLNHIAALRALYFNKGLVEEKISWNMTKKESQILWNLEFNPII